MSRPPLPVCLVLCLLTLTPAATRVKADEPSPRRKAEIDALIAKRHAWKRKQAQAALTRKAEAARQLSEARAYELNLAQVLATYQMSVERQANAQMAWAALATRSGRQRYCHTTPALTVWPGLPAYTSGPIYVTYHTPTPVNLSLPAPAPEASHPFPPHSGGSVRAEHTVQSAARGQTAVHHGLE